MSDDEISISDAVDFLAEFLVDDALRGTKHFCEMPPISFDDVSQNEEWQVALEFLIAGVHFLERKLDQFGKGEYFESLIQPVLMQSLVRFVLTAVPDQTNLKPFMDTWDSALALYSQQGDLCRNPVKPGSKQSVSGQFGTRVAAIFGEGEFSPVAVTASLALGIKLAAHAKSKVIDKALKAINWDAK